MRTVAPRLLIALAVLWLSLPAAAQEAAPAPVCPDAPIGPLLAYERDLGVSSSPIAVPVTKTQLDDQIDRLLAAPEPAPLSLDEAGLREALASALGIGFLLRDLDAAKFQTRAGLPVRQPNASTDPASPDYVAPSTANASVVIIDTGVVEVRISSRASYAGYTQSTLSFQDRATGSFSALLLTPRGRPGPFSAVIGLHGRGETPQDFAQRFMGLDLVKKGYVVLIPDFSLSDECDARISTRLLREGFTLIGVQTYQTLLTLHYLRSVDNVRPDGIALLGHSEGSGIAALLVRLRGWSYGLIEDLQTEYRDTGGPAAGGHIQRGTVPALFPYSTTVNDARTLKTPLLRVPLGYSKPAYHREIFSFLARTLGRGHKAAAPPLEVEPARLTDYLHRSLEDLKAGQRPQARAELEAALEIWRTQRLTLPADDAGPKLDVRTMGWFAGYALERVRKNPLPERLALVQELAAIRPDEPELVLARAGLEFKVGRRELAAKSLEQAHALALKFRAGDAGLRLSLAEAAADFRLGAQSAAYLAETEVLSPDARQLSRIAAMRQKDKDYAGALRALKAMTGTSTEEPHAWLGRAQAAWSAGQRELAAALLDKAQRAGPGAPENLLAQAVLLMNLGESARALDILRAAAQTQPNDAAVLIELASAANAAGTDRALALDSLDRAQALTGDPRLLRRVAVLYQKAKENEKALALLQRLTAEHPKDAASYLDRGICEYALNLSTGAISSLKIAIRLDPRLWAAYLSLGAIYRTQDQQSKAAAVYDRALAVQPVKKNDPLLAVIRKTRRETAVKARQAARPPSGGR